MLEQQRQAYLSAMGVNSWVPRGEIAGAKVSPILSTEQMGWPSVEELESLLEDITPAVTTPVASIPEPSAPIPPTHLTVEVLSQSVPAQQQTTQQQTVSPSSPLKEKKQQPLQEKSLTLSTGSKVAESQSDIAPRFALKFEVIGGSTLLVADLSDPLAPDYAAQEHKLKNDILFALGLENVGTDHFLFNWPIIRNQQLNQSRHDASQGLAGMMHGRLRGKVQFEKIILLGTYATEMFLVRHHQFDNILTEENSTVEKAIIDFKNMSPIVVVSHSLVAMLSNPLLKKHLLSRISSMIHIPSADGVGV